MTPQEFTHPEDAAALKALESIPILPSVVKKIMDFGVEQMTYGTNMASKILLSPTQLPKLYNILPPICQRLDIREPAFYLEMDPMPNAYAFGDTYTAITITSGLVEMLTEDELSAVVAHECGHILCRHLLYHTIVLSLTDYAPKFNLFGFVTDPVMIALQYWSRKSELSCDRVATFHCGPDATIRVMSRLAGGPKSITDDINLIELAEQADKYDAIRKDGAWNKTLQTYAVLGNSHPFTSVRIRETLRWVTTPEYKDLRAKYPYCPNCYRAIRSEDTFCKHCGNKLK
ncbi:MAG: M48 family metalloprotease [Bacteroidales bacterium]|nr:M48 family metalloprotease [Bacteroidales bacterium]